MVCFQRYGLFRVVDVEANNSYQMFKGGWKESMDKTVSIKNFDDETVEDFVKFLYTGRARKKTMQLLAIAHQYEVQDLVEACAEYLLTEEINPCENYYGRYYNCLRWFDSIKCNLVMLHQQQST